MNEKYVAGKKSRSLENLRHLRLMALLRDLIRDEGRMEAAEMLGVNFKTLANTVKTGDLSRRMSHALERLLLYGGGSAMARQQEPSRGWRSGSQGSPVRLGTPAQATRTGCRRCVRSPPRPFGNWSGGCGEGGSLTGRSRHGS